MLRAQVAARQALGGAHHGVEPAQHEALRPEPNRDKREQREQSQQRVVAEGNGRGLRVGDLRRNADAQVHMAFPLGIVNRGVRIQALDTVEPRGFHRTLVLRAHGREQGRVDDGTPDPFAAVRLAHQNGPGLVHERERRTGR